MASRNDGPRAYSDRLAEPYLPPRLAEQARGRTESRRERAEWRAQYAQDLDGDENLGDRDSGPDDDSDARGGLGEMTDPDVDEAESGNEEVEIA